MSVLLPPHLPWGFHAHFMIVFVIIPQHRHPSLICSPKGINQEQDSE